jgi:RNA polymerase sigma-70 factor, ECF subfamily
MSASEWVELSRQDEKMAIRKAFESYYPKLANISMRYGKDDEQAEAMIHYGFYHFITKLKTQVKAFNLDEMIGREFVRDCIRFVKELRGDYYVTSTVHIKSNESPLSEVTLQIEDTDLMKTPKEVLVQILRKLPPAQRLVFNLHVVEGFDLKQTADLMELSQEAVRFNLEKARANFLLHLRMTRAQNTL